MKRICVIFIVFETLMVCSNGQMRPFNWDQRFGTRNRNFGQDSDDDSSGGRRDFFGNNFRPDQAFPRRPFSGENDGPGQTPPPGGQTPGPAPPTPPQQGPNLMGQGPQRPMGEGPAEEGDPETEAAMGQPPTQMGRETRSRPSGPGGVQPPGGMRQPSGPGGVQPPGMMPQPSGPGAQPPMGQEREMGQGGGVRQSRGMGQGGGMGQTPTGQTEFVNPRQPPMAPPQDNEMGQGQFRGGQRPPTPSQGQPPYQQGEREGSEQEMRQRPIRQNPETRRQWGSGGRTGGQRQGNMYQYQPVNSRY